ncbi:MAG: CoA transferase [Novosphingobium sp.]|nr:CoA transferase [Novosphingobium sp.]
MTAGRDAALRAAKRLTETIAALTARGPEPVRLDAGTVLDRSDAAPLGPPGGPVSPNGSCRLLRAADHWIAVNLPREDDADLVPAWTGCAFGEPVWPAIEAAAMSEPADAFVARGAELGLAVARLGETRPEGRHGILVQPLSDTAPPGTHTRRVLDLSALWAGPLCAGVLAAAGHRVVKAQSTARPDPVAVSAPAHDARLNGRKQRLSLDFTREALLPLVAEADVIVTSARPRAFAALGLMPESLFATNPRLIWIAVTAHGWTGPGAMRTGFGDDAAVAGGLVDWRDGKPVFAGDALADPLTGLAAAAAALEAIERGTGAFIDAALARVAASASAAA